MSLRRVSGDCRGNRMGQADFDVLRRTVDDVRLQPNGIRESHAYGEPQGRPGGRDRFRLSPQSLVKPLR